jgi:hypothetical protein
VNLGDGAGVLWWSSDPEDGSGGSGNDWWSPSKKTVGARCSGEAGRWWWPCSVLAVGKTAEGAHLRFLYRDESLGTRREMPQSHPSNESKIAPKFVMDSIGFGS